MFSSLRRTVSNITSKLSERYCSHVLGIYSQYGEDIVLDRLLKSPGEGFYVDIGANDPVKFSNTLRFYNRGWRGVNIEPNPKKYNDICLARPADVNLNVGVGVDAGVLPFYIIDPDTLSTFDRRVADTALSEGFRLSRTIDIQVVCLEKVLAEHGNGGRIDFMSIDVEGAEIQVLRSNDWRRYRPRLILIEVNRAEIEIEGFLSEIDYIDIYSNGTNKIYADSRRNLSRAFSE